MRHHRSSRVPLPTLLPLLVLVTVAVALGVGPAGAETGDGGDHPYVFAYPLEHLDPTLAASLLWDLCPAEDGDRCQVAAPDDTGRIRLYASAPVQRRAASLLIERDVVPPSPLLRIDLVLLERNGDGAEGSLGTLPPAVRRTVDELRFLAPHARLRLLDSAQVRTTGSSGIHLGGDGRALSAQFRLLARQGTDGPHYRLDPFELRAHGAAGDPDAYRGALLSSQLALEPSTPRVLGVTRLSPDGPHLVAVATLSP